MVNASGKVRIALLVCTAVVAGAVGLLHIRAVAAPAEADAAKPGWVTGTVVVGAGRPVAGAAPAKARSCGSTTRPRRTTRRSVACIWTQGVPVDAATRDSWKTIEMPELREQLCFRRVFSRVEHGRLKQGLIPREMQDKWFVFLEGDWLYCHRSWTGVCIYRLRFTRIGEQWHVDEVWANRDPEQYAGTDSGRDIRELHRLLDRLLRGS